ncbi:MAG: SPOR domain-containing protein [Gemmatimonadaceae bacterium]
MLKAICWTAILALAPAMAVAQTPQSPLNPAYTRAQSMVNNGDLAGGRAVVDSMIALAQPGSNEYAEAMYWRAVLAASAAEAEMDYRRVAIDYPRSPRAEESLIRLAQMEMARGNADGALKHLTRLSEEHPFGTARAKGSYWTARALFDKNDVQGGCAATVDALSRTTEADTELRNQINYLNQRCAGVVLADVKPAEATTSGSTTPVLIKPAPVNSGTTSQPVAQVIPPTASPVETVVKTAGETAVALPAAAAPITTTPVTTRPAATPVETPPPRTSAVVLPPETATEVPRKTTPVKVDAPKMDKPAGGYSVQIAAYSTKAPAEALVAKLKTSGYEARVDGTGAPFRVRIGRYATQAQAGAVQRSLKAKQITGFVVEADIR